MRPEFVLLLFDNDRNYRFSNQARMSDRSAKIQNTAKRF